MKNQTKYYHTFLLPAILMLLIFQNTLFAQDSTSEKKKGYLTLKYVKENGEGKVYFNLITREGKKKEPVQFTIVNLYLNEVSKLGMMGNITTDETGAGFVLLDKKFASQTDTMNEYTFIGSLMNDPRIMETQTELVIKPATLELSVYEEDSVKYAKAVLKAKDEEGNWVPVPEIEIAFFVKRYFSLLPVSEYPVATDENGEALLEFPAGVKGDSLGKLTVVAKLDAHDEYGTLLASKEANFGIPVIQKISHERLLSGSRYNAPISLIIVSTVIITGVWGIIIYIITQLFKIKSFNKSKITEL